MDYDDHDDLLPLSSSFLFEKKWKKTRELSLDMVRSVSPPLSALSKQEKLI
jgi:hypothetical protein